MPESISTLAPAIRRIVAAQGDDANTDSVLDALADEFGGKAFDRSLVAMILLEVLEGQPAEA